MFKPYFTVLCILISSSLICAEDYSLSSTSYRNPIYNQLEVSMETAYWNYEESRVNGDRFMREIGRLNGVNVKYKSLHDVNYKMTFLTGEADYDGGYSDGTPLTLKGTPQSLFELSALYNYRIVENRKTDLSIIFGLYYRLHSNPEQESVRGDYDRSISQTILPIGLSNKFLFNSRLSLDTSFQYHTLLVGTVTSDLTNVSSAYPRESIKRQNKGQGFLFQTRLNYLYKDYAFFLGTYLREWTVGRSDKDTMQVYGDFGQGEGYYNVAFTEPKNKTRMMGVNMGMTF